MKIQILQDHIHRDFYHLYYPGNIKSDWYFLTTIYVDDFASILENILFKDLKEFGDKFFIELDIKMIFK